MRTGRFGAAVALPVAALLLTACGEQPASPDDPASAGRSWTVLPSPPLSPRLGAVTAWTGTEALFLGGDVGDLCPPNAGCAGPAVSAADGAAFDPATETWRPVADAPHPIPAGTPSTVSGDTVHLVQGDRIVSYDASEDAWSVSPAAPGGEGIGDPAVLDDGRVALSGAERRAGDPSGQVYDPAGRTWSELPDDPLGPTFDRALTAVPGGLVLTATPTPEDWDTVTEPPPLRGALLDLTAGTWTTLGETRRSGGWRWAWTGERMVDVYPDGVDGSGQRFPQGGALDPRTGEWSALPGTPVMSTGGWPADAIGGPLAAVDGWVYDDRDRTWTRLERPDGAPAQPGSAVWAGGDLIVVGGMDTDAGWGAEHLSDGAWGWRPAAAAELTKSSPATQDLTGVRWVLESEVEDGDAREPSGAREASLTFRADGTVDVDTGCVEGTTRWRTVGDAVEIEEFGWAGLACSEAEFEQQGPLFDTWSSFRPTVEGDVLTLVPTDAAGVTLVYRAG